MSVPSPISTPATSPLPQHPTFASALIPPTPAIPARLASSSNTKPLLSSRLSQMSTSSIEERLPTAPKQIPSRYSNCELCKLVRETRAKYRQPSTHSRQVSSESGGTAEGSRRWRAVEEDGSSDAGSSNTTSPTRPEFKYQRGPSKGKAVAYAQPGQTSRSYSAHSSSKGQTIEGREILYHDSDITIYPAVGRERMRKEGKHLIVVINTHAENVYELGPVDIPLLSKIIETSQQLLDPHMVEGEVRVGFVGSVIKDPQSPHAHLHAHAMAGPPDSSLPGASFWRRNVVFGWGNWWSAQDLRAEIREGSSNNRIKSGYENRVGAPIDKVSSAGSRSGLPNALNPQAFDPYAETPLDTPPTASSSSSFA